jgi:hypothetical protein
VANTQTYEVLELADRATSMSRVTYTPDSGPTISGLTLDLVVSRAGGFQSASIATLSLASSITLVPFYPYEFSLPQQQGNAVTIQAQDVLCLRLTGSGTVSGTFPAGFLRIDSFLRH